MYITPTRWTARCVLDSRIAMVPAVPAVALFLLSAGIFAAAAPYPNYLPVQSDPGDQPPYYPPDDWASPSQPSQDSPDPTVVLASGRRVPLATHRRLVNLLNRKTPVSVELPSGHTLQFGDVEEFLSKAPTSHLDGGQFVVPAENWPVEVAKEVVETEKAHRVHVELPTGERVPYYEYVRAPQQHPSQLHRPHNRPYQGPPYDRSGRHLAEKDVPDDQLFIVLGNGQRLLFNVHEAIHSHHTRKQPFDVQLVSGAREKIGSYEDLLKKLLDPRYMDCSVRASPDVSVPIETYRAVTNAHNHGGVYVEYPDGRRELYSEFMKRRDSTKKDAFIKEMARHEQDPREEGCCGGGFEKGLSRRANRKSRSRTSPPPY